MPTATNQNDAVSQPPVEQTQHAIPLACNLNAMTSQQRERHQRVLQQLDIQHGEIHEVTDGYAIRYPGNEVMCLAIAEFISLEHLCCPFFRLTLEVEPGQGSIWLRLTGDSSVKQFILAEMGLG